MTHRLLVVEDDPDQRRLVAGILRGRGFAVGEAAGFAEAEAALEHAPDRPGALRLAAARRRRHAPARPGHASSTRPPPSSWSPPTAPSPRRSRRCASGADDYLAKPFERQSLLLAIDKVLVKRRLLDENLRLAAALAERDRLVDLLGAGALHADSFSAASKRSPAPKRPC